MNERIKEARKLLKLTQEEFAEKIGVARNSVTLIELGTRNPSDRTIRDICKTFGINEEWLRTGDGEMFVERSKSEIIEDFLVDILNDDLSFKRRLIEVLAELPDDKWEWLEELVLEIAKKYEEK